MMTKLKVIRDVSYRTGYSQNDVKDFLQAFIDSVTDAVNRGETVTIKGLMRVYYKHFPARTRFSFIDDKVIEIPEVKQLSITPYIKIKE